MPFCWYTFDRLGVVDKMDAIGFTQKHSVQFAGMSGKISKPFYFFQHRDHPSSVSWQVERKDFDQMLFDNAREKGATVVDGIKVKDVVRDESGAVVGVETMDANGKEVSYSAAIIIDASGRDALVASKSKWRSRDPELKKVGIWTYYEGAKRDPGLDAGSTTVCYLPEKGWIWYIPMRDNRVSVGVVGERDYLYSDSRDLAEITDREIEKNAWVIDHLEGAKQVGEYWVTGEYSYRSKYCAADGVVLVGDAFAFLDPVFSSGVFLALKTGELAADAVEAALDANDTSAQRFTEYGETVCAAMERMRKIVYAFYDEDFSFGKLIRKNEGMHKVLTDLLIGDLFEEKYQELFAAVDDIAKTPQPLDYGMRVPSVS
jgi:flavin-dependent dehydrogenase